MLSGRNYIIKTLKGFTKQRHVGVGTTCIGTCAGSTCTLSNNYLNVQTFLHYHKDATTNSIDHTSNKTDSNRNEESHHTNRSTTAKRNHGKTTLFLNKNRSISSKSPILESSTSKYRTLSNAEIIQKSLQKPAGPLFNHDIHNIVKVKNNDTDNDNDAHTTFIEPGPSDFFIPEVSLHENDGRKKHRVLVLCTGGTLTMAPDPSKNGALAPVEGAVTSYMKEMKELLHENMPEVIVHEYSPFYDSSDMGPSEWAVLANDIYENYYHFDGFVVLMGTDTMAYCATALSFMLENLGKPVVFTGSQIPLSEPYNDARRNLIMALIFASRDSIPEVCIFFHDRLLRACRTSKVNTQKLLAFNSPNLEPLATIGINIDENEHLALPRARGALRRHIHMDTRLLTIRLVPGFDDQVIRHIIESNSESNALKVLVIQLYGTGNAPSVKKSFVQLIGDAVDKGIMVVATTQCHTGSVLLGHYATGVALAEAGVVSGNDMTLEAISCKAAYLLGRGDLSQKEVSHLMGVSLRGEVTPTEALSPPPFASPYQTASRKGKIFY